MFRSAAAVRSAAELGDAAGELRLRTVRRTPIRVRGPVSGREYLFTRSDPVRSVDPADGPAMLRSGLFRSVR
jgi:hypothetical protein